VIASNKNIQQKGNKVTHIVQQGDSWWDIAQRHKVGVEELTSWNNKQASDYLQPGQELVLWTQANTALASDSPRSVNYTIRSGDSLWTISKKFNVTIAQVRKWNSLGNKVILQPGQDLQIFVDETGQYDSI